MFHGLLLPPRKNSYAYLIVETSVIKEKAAWILHVLHELCDTNILYRLQHPSFLKESLEMDQNQIVQVTGT